jgi:hypothetical protein
MLKVVSLIFIHLNKKIIFKVKPKNVWFQPLGFEEKVVSLGSINSLIGLNLF